MHTGRIMSRTRKLLVTALVVVVVGTLGTYGAFTATTANTGNEITSGTVAVSDSDGGNPLIVRSGAQPGTYSNTCIRLTYSGSLPATIRAYRSGIDPAANDRYGFSVHKASAGSLTSPGSSMSCAGVTSWSGRFSMQDLEVFGTTYAGGTDVKGSTFSPGETIDLLFQTYIYDGTSANGNTTPNATGNFELTFEARSS